MSEPRSIDLKIRDPELIKIFKEKKDGKTYEEILKILLEYARSNVDGKFNDLGETISTIYGNPVLKDMINIFCMIVKFTGINTSKEHSKDANEELLELYQQWAKKWRPEL